MSFKLDFKIEQVTATFTNVVEENEIQNAFLEIIDTIQISKLKHIVLDFSDIVSYVIPKDYMKTLKMITQFSATWNTNVKVIIVATNTEIRTVASSIIEHQEDHIWEYQLFEDLESAKKQIEKLTFKRASVW